MRGTVLLLGMGLAITGCMPDSDLALLPQPTDRNYRLGVGDQIRIITYNETQLTNTFIVGDDGTIAFPLVGTVKAAGLTSRGLASALSSELVAKQLMQNPSVSVQVAEYRPISVLGEVNHPGQYPYAPGMTMLDAVALAGGFTYRAVTAYGKDVRTQEPGDTGPVTGRVEPGSHLEPGDVVTILERYF